MSNESDKKESIAALDVSQEKSSLDLTASALDKVAETMSPPNPDIHNVAQPGAENTGTVPGEQSQEKVFNPEIHETGSDGRPVMTPTGRYKLKKGVRARGLNIHVPETDTDEQRKAKMVAAQRMMAANVLVDTFINTGVMVFGEEWKPEIQKAIIDGKEISASERDTLIATTEMYLAAKNINDIPPGVCLAIVFSSYCMKRVPKPETSKRLAIIFGGFRARVGMFFGKVKGMFAKKK